jgi:hypothetical protein
MPTSKRQHSPFLNLFVKLAPSAEVEIPNAEIGPVRDAQGGFEAWQKLLVDVVEDPRHGRVPVRANALNCKEVRLYLKSTGAGRFTQRLCRI